MTTRPSAVTSTLDGLMSRCSLPSDAVLTRRRRVAAARGRVGRRRRLGSIGASRVIDEAHALDELHREKTAVVLDEQLVEAGEIRVSDVGETSKLPFQPIQIGGTGPQQGLQRDDLVAHSVVHLVDHAHSPRAQPSHDAKARGAGKRSSASTADQQSGGRSRNERACWCAANSRITSVSRSGSLAQARSTYPRERTTSYSSASSKTARRRRCQSGVWLMSRIFVFVPADVNRLAGNRPS